MLNIKGSSILITGGTGSFGQAMTKHLCDRIKNIKRLVIFSRDELKQSKMQEKFPQKKYPFIRFFIGDVRDEKRITRALKGIDIVIHAAALKQVVSGEYNPFEVINTNIIGAQNVIEACLNTDVKKVVALSSDKASSPLNLYGATKLCADKLFIAANNYTGKKKLSFSVVRYGNVMGSRGSVIPLFIKQKEKGILSITDKEMTRFNITMTESINLVIWTIQNSYGADIIVPKIPSYRIIDVVKSICENCKIQIIGKRPGEKLHEEMISSEESSNTISTKKYYIILQQNNHAQKKYYNKKLFSKSLPKNFSYYSKSNSTFLSVADLKKLIKNSKTINEKI
jgi:UDP-N-acetylglucosamine 4,6-dehydratase/5-epimerase